MVNILERLIEYIKEHNKSFKAPKGNNPCMCPICEHPDGTAIILPTVYKMLCQNPACKSGGNVGDIADLVKHYEPEKSHFTRPEIIDYLAKKYNIDFIEQNTTDIILDYYESHNFDLVPVGSNQKIPIEKGWPTKNHKNKSEWKDWLGDNLNIGIKTGKVSGVTVIDIDQFPTPPEILALLGEQQTLYQRTTNGSHYFFQYEADLPKTRIVDLKIDIENDGGQVIAPPSKVDDKERKIELYEIQKMPDELKKFLLEQTADKSHLRPLPPARPDDVKFNLDDLKFDGMLSEGNRHHNFMKFGGLLRKKMPLSQVSYTLNMINTYLTEPPLTPVELQNVISSIDKYVNFDEKELAYQVLDYIDKVEEATARDVREALEYKKDQIDTALAFLSKEGYVVRKRRFFKAIKKMQWREEFMDSDLKIKYKMPYFNDAAIFREGDLIIIGAKTGVGKSHIAVNIMKRLIDQGIKPKYVNLESANRFLAIAKSLGLKEGDFDWVVNFSPETMELDDNSFTIIDWLLPNDYAETDKIYKYFAEQLGKHKGILMVFVQLKATGEFFAPNQIEMFPSLAAKFMYDDDTGETGGFHLTKIREGKGKERFGVIPTVYNWSGKELLTVPEHEAKKQGAKAKPKTESSLETIEANKEVSKEDFM